MNWDSARKLHPWLPESSDGWHQHQNGGGWVRDGVVISETIYVGEPCVIFGGVFRGGVFHDGVFHGGVFHDGVFHGGVFRGGVFYGGEFYDGVFRGGVFYGGEFYDGVFHGGVFHDGEFRGGVFRGGVFRGGVFRGGEFYDGVFYGGVWNRTPVFVSGVTRYSVCEVGPDEIKIGCECGKISELETLLPQWFAEHNTTPDQQERYRAACALVALVAKQSPIEAARKEEGGE